MQDLKIEITRVTIVVLSTIGLVECMKNAFKPKKTSVWCPIMIATALVVSFVEMFLEPKYLGDTKFLTYAFLAIAMCQLCYDTIIKGLKAIVRVVANKAVDKVEKSTEDKLEEGE